MTIKNIILAAHIIGLLMIGMFIVTMDIVLCLSGLALVMISDVAIVLTDVLWHEL